MDKILILEKMLMVSGRTIHQAAALQHGPGAHRYNAWYFTTACYLIWT